MKKLLKGLMAIALVFSSMFVATACGKDDDTGNQEQEEENVIAYEDITDFTVVNHNSREKKSFIKDYTGTATEVTIPSKYKKDGVIYTIEEIGDETFMDNDNITKVVIPNTIVRFGKRVFKKCSSLESIVIPNSVKGISSETFEGCTKLSSVTFEEGATHEGMGIGMYAFKDCVSLTSIAIPSSISSIGWGAFYNSALSTITIPASINTIDREAFYNCNQLTTVNYLGTAEEWDEISISSIDNDDLTNATINFSGLE